MSGVNSKPSPDRCGAPGLLWIAPVDAGEQIPELGGRDRHHPVGGARPEEAPPLEALGEQAGALTVMPDDLQEITSATTEAEQMAA